MHLLIQNISGAQNSDLKFKLLCFSLSELQDSIVQSNETRSVPCHRVSLSVCKELKWFAIVGCWQRAVALVAVGAEVVEVVVSVQWGVPELLLAASRTSRVICVQVKPGTTLLL